MSILRKSEIEKPIIRFIKLQTNTLLVVYGKHNYADRLKQWEYNFNRL